MEYNLCYDIDYKCVFDVDRVVFWATRIKDVSHRKHRVRLLYPALAVSDTCLSGFSLVLAANNTYVRWMTGAQSNDMQITNRPRMAKSL